MSFSNTINSLKSGVADKLEADTNTPQGIKDLVTTAVSAYGDDDGVLINYSGHIAKADTDPDGSSSVSISVKKIPAEAVGA